MHQHEVTADAIVIEGEFWLTVEGQTRHLNPGDSFHVPALVRHKEKYGPEGMCFLGCKNLIALELADPLANTALDI